MFKAIIGFFKWLIEKIKGWFIKDETPDDMVCYYGCPNSNRTKELQLKAEKIR